MSFALFSFISSSLSSFSSSRPPSSSFPFLSFPFLSFLSFLPFSHPLISLPPSLYLCPFLCFLCCLCCHFLSYSFLFFPFISSFPVLCFVSFYSCIISFPPSFCLMSLSFHLASFFYSLSLTALSPAFLLFPRHCFLSFSSPFLPCLCCFLYFLFFLCFPLLLLPSPPSLPHPSLSLFPPCTCHQLHLLLLNKYASFCLHSDLFARVNRGQSLPYISSYITHSGPNILKWLHVCLCVFAFVRMFVQLQKK